MENPSTSKEGKNPCPNCGYIERKREKYCLRCKKVGQNTEYNNFCYDCNPKVLKKLYERDTKIEDLVQEFIDFCDGKDLEKGEK